MIGRSNILSAKAWPGLWLTMCLLLAAGAPTAIAQSGAPNSSVVRVAAGWVDTVLSDVAASAEALGQEYALLTDDYAGADTAEAADWKERAVTLGRTTGFRTWDDASPEPSFQAAYPALYSYNGSEVTPGHAAELQNLATLVPVVRSAYRSLGFSWVYLTTADNHMLIYPYVPLNEAIHNDPPTEQAYYTAADLDRRTVGWTAPYLDLVGAGMMVTASYPVFSGDRLLGVASRDITLKELSRSVLGRLAASNDATALLVDARGMAIGASARDLEAEIESVNREAGAAALFYRSQEALDALGVQPGRPSGDAWLNRVVDRIFEGGGDDDGVTEFELDGRPVYSARIESTGWLIVLAGADPEGQN
jgi:hypothetical protein